MDGFPDTPPEERASQACLACRKQKRKCDKALPACTLCSRMKRACNYTDVGSPNGDELALLRDKVQLLEAKLESVSVPADSVSQESLRWSPGSNVTSISTSGGASFPSVFFLDTELFTRIHGSIPKPQIPVPAALKASLGTVVDIQAIINTYFASVHDWLPMVSKTRLHRKLSNAFPELSADLVLLLTSMKMIISYPQDGMHPADAPLYRAVKQFLATVEISGLLTIHVLQSALLIAAYEIGHSIYPAAHLSIGYCARLGQVLALHDRHNSPAILPKPSTWGEGEENVRTWYAVLILDRYVNIGSYGHPLLSGEFHRRAVLPCDDDSFDRAEITPSQPIFVSSSTSVKAGAYARICQAAHLLGQVISHRDDRDVESTFRFTSAMQIHATSDALSKVLADEFKHSPGKLSTALALLYTARLSLYDPYACTGTNHGDNTVEETQMQEIAINGLKENAQDIVHLSQSLRSHLGFDISSVSPLICDCVYQAAANFAWLRRENGDPQADIAFRILVDFLELVNTRWKVAGEYSKMLEIAEEKIYSC
ncbi:hypothetical protein Plec18170_004647 [Paecilomyces lecythidis]